MTKYLGLLLITFSLFLTSYRGAYAEPPFSDDIPILAKPYDESTFIDTRGNEKNLIYFFTKKPGLNHLPILKTFYATLKMLTRGSGFFEQFT